MLTFDRLREVLRYDPETGAFIWICPTRTNSPVGSAAGRVDNRGYVRIGIDHRYYQAHRLAWFYMTGSWPTAQIDHVDRQKANNRFANLREATGSLNCANTPGRVPGKPKGISLIQQTGRWHVQIKVKGVSRYLGVFGNKAEAAAAYERAARDAFGEFACVENNEGAP